MKIQSVCTLDQAQRLDRAIKEAGLEWPGIEWKHWVCDCSEDGKLILSQSGVDLIDELEAYTPKRIIPAPTGMELAAMIPEDDFEYHLEPSQITPGNLVEIIIDLINDYHLSKLKAHWATLK